MHLQESQQPFLDRVQKALHQYDAQLRDINHKVPGPNLSPVQISTLTDTPRSGPTQSLHTKNTKHTKTSANFLRASNLTDTKYDPKCMV